MPLRRKGSDGLEAKVIGQRLRELRNRQGATQAKVAERVGLSQTLVSDYEIGRLRMHAGLVVSFAKALGVSTDDILGLRKGKQNGSSDRRFLRRLSKIDQLPEREKRHLLGTIDAVLRGSGIS